MSNWLYSQFNKLVSQGTNLTHIANAYSKNSDDWIWICCQKDELEPAKVERVLKPPPDVSVESNWNTNMNAPLWKIPYRDHHQLSRTEPIEYLTVVSHDGKLLYLNYKILSNRSFIVTKDGGLKPQKYASWNFFQDHCGVIH
jgi:hypothetical protein